MIFKLLAPLRPIRIAAPGFDAIAIATAFDLANRAARFEPTNHRNRLIARWQRNPASGRLECRWRTAPAAFGDEEPPPASTDRCASRAIFIRAVISDGAARPGRIEVPHDERTPSPPAISADRRARAVARAAQHL